MENINKDKMKEVLGKASSYIGLKELSASGGLNSEVERFFKTVWINKPSTVLSWCSAFLSTVLEECHVASTRSGKASSYLDWGVELKEPVDGCIVVFNGEINHVGFFVGYDSSGNLRVLGGNQSDQVKISTFPAKYKHTFRGY